MANRWLNLLLGVALFQGVLSFGPIDETEEEWIEYRNMMRDPSYRLSRNTVPSNYVVNLTPHLGEGANQFTFDGDVTITISALVATSQIVLHCNNLTIDSSSVSVVNSTANTNMVMAGQVFTCDPQSFLRINVNSPLQVSNTYTVRMSFRGRLQTNMRGFYRSWYLDRDGNRRWMATTQFQPGHARQAFPCYDEPGFKATFNISITRDSEGFNPTLSNMPIRVTENLANGKVKETFYRTPVTSTYLLAFIVSGYERVASNNHDTRPFYIYARGNIPTGSGDYSLRVGVPLLEVMGRYTAQNYYTLSPDINNMVMQQAAIPDFSAGAMENWGLLTYREALIIYDPENSNNFYKQRIANIISHEIAHMWFGNLVTCAWWDNLWLNEGFARFYQYYLTHIVEPEMGFETRFITEQVQVSLLSDSSISSHPLTDSSVNSPTAVSAHFSQITYGKGASVLRMTQHLLGNNTYVAGLQNYLRTNAFNTAEPTDLFNALTAAVTAAGTAAVWPYTGTTVTQYLTSWTTLAGHPLLFVNVNHVTGQMVVQQSRFFSDTGVTDTNTGLWHIPITWTRGLAPDFVDLKPTQIMTSAQVIIPRTTTGNEWVIFNKQQAGFYRVNYDPTTWNLITRALRGSDRLLIHEYNRAQIVDDVFLLARSNRMNYRQAFNILSFLKFEDQYAPWLAAITGFNFALRRLAHESLATSRLRAEILDLSTAIVARLGFTEPANGGTFMDDLLRMHVMTFLCNVGHQGCINAATTSFQNWRINGTRIAPNMRPWVYCNGLRYGTAEDYDFFWNRYLNTDLANEQVVMIQSAGCTRHQPSLNRFLANVISDQETNFIVRAQDQSSGISSAITSNEENTMMVFQWLQLNLDRVKAAGVLNSMLTSITSRLLTERDILLMQNWVTEYAEALEPAAVNAATTGIATARANIAFYTARINEFLQYFEEGYDNPLDPTTTTMTAPVTTTPVTVPSTDPTTAPTTLAPTTTESETTTEVPTTTSTSTSTSAPTTTVAPTTAAPDSANLASLSIVTLIVTLVINMA